MNVVHIDPAGTGDARSVTEALARLEGFEGPAHLRLVPGVYREKVFTDRADLTLEGLGREPGDTVLVWGDHAKRLLPDGQPMRTFNSATLFVGGDGFTAENLSVVNDAGAGSVAGQAVAAYVDADRAVFRRCQLLGHQDTLFTGPLPPFPRDHADFGGPRDTGPGRLSVKAAGSPAVGHQLYEDCLIVGDIDFVFGSAEAVFRRCEVRSRALPEGAPSWVSAASTPDARLHAPRDDGFLDPAERLALAELGQRLGRPVAPHGHLFSGCRFTAEPGVAPGTVYLGRPWRNDARTVLLDCWLGEHVNPAGWDDWGKAEARSTVVYAEVGSTGPGARPSRVAWATVSGGGRRAECS